MMIYLCCIQVGFQAIAEALGLAAVKALVAIAAIIAGGRLVNLTHRIFHVFHINGRQPYT